MRDYFRNWWLYLHFRWLWTKRAGCSNYWLKDDGFLAIYYKPGWGPAKFLIPYLTTYLLGTLFGCGVVSLSRWWYDRSQQGHPFSRFMTRLLDWAFPGSKHGRHTGPRLWGSVDLWNR